MPTPSQTAKLTALVGDMLSEEWKRGFERGREIGMRQAAKPAGFCSRCGSELEWNGLPDSCGCRECKCKRCGLVHVSACMGCEASGV